MWTYEQAKARRDELEAAVKSRGAKLRTYKRTGAGLTIDAVKSTPEWQKDRVAYHRAFNALRSFNTAFLKQFDAEIRAERNAR